MVLSLNGQTSEIDAFKFWLAAKLHKFVCEIDEIPHSEMTKWRSYWSIKNEIDAMHARAAR